ncbi:MAG: hypothetical protein NTZ74_13580 [Chloroflexi bacterium]|nr:hypothetical protein [Chloroflexota bacterium]
MKRVIPVFVFIALLLSSCSLLDKFSPQQQLSDAEMATRVAELLATMTTPTEEIVFPPTATLRPPTLAPTATAQPTMVEQTLMPIQTLEVGGEIPTLEITTDMIASTPEPTATLAPTATATVPPADPINKLGSPSSFDPMDSESKWAWPIGSDDYLNVEFVDGFMKMTNLSSKSAGWRLPLVSQQLDTYIELTANSGTCSTKDSYGIIFRVPVFKEPDQGYLYQVTCDGYYRLWKWNGRVSPDGLATSLIVWKQSTDIKVGPNQTNRLGVMVVDDKITLFMNGVPLGSVTDTSYSAGFFGVFVRSGGSTNYTAKLDSMQFWENPKQ